jgi:hypothetical protein
LNWEGGGFEVRVGLLWVFVLVVCVVFFGWIRRRIARGMRGHWKTERITLTFMGQEWHIVPDNETRRIAYQAWVECQSRKVGLLFEEEHDVIVEVYNSWYQMFAILRELAKSVPAERLREKDSAQELVRVLMAVLNEGLRPHLTRWQACFRRWYAKASELPQYKELVADLKGVNGEFVKFAERLLYIVNAR